MASSSNPIPIKGMANSFALRNVTKSKEKCRICLKEANNIPIFGSVDISNDIKLVTGIRITKGDNHPKSICEECYKLLESAVLFVEMAVQTNNLLKQQECYIKTEPPLKQEKVQIEVDIKREVNKETDEESSDDGTMSDDDYMPDMKKPIKNEFISNKGRKIKLEPLNVTKEESSSNYQKKYQRNCEAKQLAVVSDLPEDGLHCKFCDVNCKTLADYNLHVQSKEHEIGREKKKSEKQMKHCRMCNESFTKHYYNLHRKEKHRDNSNDKEEKKECPLCKREMFVYRFAHHMKMSHPEKTELQCPYCNNMIPTNLYRDHCKKVHRETVKRLQYKKNQICHQCGKNFNSAGSLAKHLFTHTNVFPFRCTYCEYRSRTKDLLQVHVRTHTGDYRYTCTECGTRCISKSNLTSHMKRHRGPIDFKCDTCGKGYYTKPDLQRHIESVHMGLKNHICNICGSAFGTKKVLNRHELRVHKRAKGEGKPKASYLKCLEEEIQANTSALDAQLHTASPIHPTSIIMPTLYLMK